MADEDVYTCPAGERLTHRFTSEEHGRILRRYWTTACVTCAIKDQCTLGKELRISRWEHEHVLEAVQRRLGISLSNGQTIVPERVDDFNNWAEGYARRGA